MEEKKQEAIIEAILFTVGESVELEKLAAVLELDKEKTKTLVEHLRERYESDTCGMKIIELDGAYQMCTKAEYYEYLIKIAKQPKKRVLTDVLLETLSIIAYKQSITKAEVPVIMQSTNWWNTIWSVNSDGSTHRADRCSLAQQKNFCAVLAWNRSMSFRY